MQFKPPPPPQPEAIVPTNATPLELPVIPVPAPFPTPPPPSNTSGNGWRLAHPLCADKTARPILRAQVLHSDHASLARRVHELIAADHDADV